MSKSASLPFQLALALVLLLAIASFPSPVHSAHHPKRPKKFTFYLHNTIFNATLNNTDYFNSVFSVIPSFSFANTWSFGVIAIFEDPLTVSVSNSSTQLGVGQGFYIYDSQKGYVLFMAFTATISTGKYNGTIDIFGQMKEVLPIRTLSVIGGTGDFLLARGFASCRLVDLYTGPPGAARWTISFDLDLYY